MIVTTIAGTTNDQKSQRSLVNVRAEGIPDCLLQAKQAMESQQMERARALLSEDRLKPHEATIMDRTDLMLMVALMYGRLDALDSAAYWYRQVLAKGSQAMACQELARICRLQGQFREATRLRLDAVALEPENLALQISAAVSLTEDGHWYEGVERLKAIVSDHPDCVDAHDKLLFALRFGPQPTRQALYEAHCQWAEQHHPVTKAQRHHQRNLDPQRRLRIGYLSADFCRHAAAYNFESILDGHDREQVEIFGYGSVHRPDAMTARLCAKFDHYRDIVSLSDREVAYCIDADKIDILIEIGGIAAGHRLGVMGFKPAPIQVDLQGLTTTGLSQVDYRLTDPYLDPEGCDCFYTEQCLHLEVNACYTPPAWAPEVGPPPCLHHGYVTFGSFANHTKMHPRQINLWSQVLKAVPDARFLIKCAGSRDAGIRTWILDQFRQQGMDPERIEIVPWCRPQEHMALYNRVDIALDTFPFNGGMTTLEGLWMGVPAITLLGETVSSRMGLATLAPLGMTSLVADSPQMYVEKAVALARNIDALTKIRAGLRDRMEASPLRDSQRYASHLEQAYRSMWTDYCQRQKPAKDQIEFFISETSDIKYSVCKEGLPPALFEAAHLAEHGHVDQAAALLQGDTLTAIEHLANQTPPRWDALFALAMLLHRLEKPYDAEPYYRRLAKQESHPLICFELATICAATHRLHEALDWQRQACALAPESTQLKAGLGDLLIRVGQAEEGIGLLRHLAETSHDDITGSKYLWHLHQTETFDNQALYEAHADWGQRYAPMIRARKDHQRDRDPDRRLRVGYLSPDFCSHSVAYFFELWLQGHDRAVVEPYGYSNVASQDAVTDRLRDGFSVYRNICGVSDEAVAEQIERDKIDILVDLAGHTSGNRLLIFATRPAPIQVTCIGYPDTTGMRQMDYRFTDPWADTPEAGAFYTEELVYLENGFNCYQPPHFAPAVKSLPALKNGFVTFGSFNNNCKLNPRTLSFWAEILRGVPQSRLLLKFDGGGDPCLQNHYRQHFREQGIAAERIRIVGRLDVVDHLELYNEVDIGLDTFPYNGTTTTCEALWMGVPTVSLVGNHHASRVGLSLLTRVGLEVFAAHSPQEYIQKAIRFAGELDPLALIRQSSRAMMMQSRLCQGEPYAREVEQAYRRMWHRWLNQTQ